MTALAPLATLSRRRFQLTVHTPRELVVPLVTPMLFALVIAPALKQALHTGTAYEAFVAIGTVGLLVPLNTMFSGLGVIVDRENGPSGSQPPGRMWVWPWSAVTTKAHDSGNRSSRSPTSRSAVASSASKKPSWRPWR